MCDSPGRAIVNGAKCCGDYGGCDECEQHGTWCGKVTYPETAVALREDEEFSGDHGSYIREMSPFTEKMLGWCLSFL